MKSKGVKRSCKLTEELTWKSLEHNNYMLASLRGHVPFLHVLSTKVQHSCKTCKA